MPYTHHGHFVDSGPLEEKPPLVARCGGAALCMSCAKDAGHLMDPRPVKLPPVDQRLVVGESPTVTIDAQLYHQLVRARQLVMDLDRCVHGRHAADECFDCAKRRDDVPEQMRRFSRGNPYVRPGVVVGYGRGGQRIVMPAERADQLDASKWYVP